MTRPSEDEETIDLWLCLPSEYEGVAECTSLLSPDEIARKDKFVFAKDRNQYTFARALLRSVLSHYQPEISPQNWKFDYNAHGKPDVVNGPGRALQFNVSHANNVIALGIRHHQPIGVDTESTTRDNDLASLARYCFTPKEQDYVFSNMAMPGEEALSRDRFFALWTLKEAVVKAIGKGISIGLKSFEFHRENDRFHVSGLAPEYPQNWTLFQWSIQNQSIAIAVPIAHADQPQRIKLNIYRTDPLGNHRKMDLINYSKWLCAD